MSRSQENKMFTGIIQSVGHVKSVQNNDGDLQFEIATNFSDMSDVSLGDSIAINGVCLTVTQIINDVIKADVSVETITKTNVSFWHKGSHLNLEKSLTLKDKLGGHLVSGHVDSVAEMPKYFPKCNDQLYTNSKFPMN